MCTHIQTLIPNRHSAQVFSPRGLTFVSFLTSTVLFTLIWAGTNYMYSRALLSTSPTDVTALFSSAPAFVFLLSVLILREPPLILRVSTRFPSFTRHCRLCVAHYALYFTVLSCVLIASFTMCTIVDEGIAWVGQSW